MSYEKPRTYFKRERYWIESYDTIENGLNDRLPWVSEEESNNYRKQYQKQHRLTNKEQIRQRQTEKILCEKCGKLSMRSSMARHQRSQNCI